MPTESPTPLDPREVYSRGKNAAELAATRSERLHVRLGNVRLLLVLLAAAILIFSGPVWVLIAAAAVFAVLWGVDDRVIRDRERARRATVFHKMGLDRLDDKWVGSGEDGARFLDLDHPYAEDLDVFGEGSFFERISRARTRAGEDTLAAWLLTPASPAEIQERQQAVAELAPMVELRETLAVLGEDVRTGVHAQELADWGRDAPAPPNGKARLLALALSVALVTVFVLWWMDVSLIPFLRPRLGAFTPVLVVSLLEIWFATHYRGRVLWVLRHAELAGRDLKLLSEILRVLERQDFLCRRLQNLRTALDTEGHAPSGEIARLSRWMELLDSREHLLLRMIGPPLLWTTQMALAIENWHRHNGPAVERWISVAGEFEALSSLASYAFECPGDPFPEMSEDAPCFDAEGLTHPLLPATRAVRNDVRLDAANALFIVSGSNMSGKTTLLRSIGSNAMLALAGAPVRARKLRLSPLAIGASIRVHDSLRDGRSRFYWEIQRIRQLFDIAAKETPLLFLLDELLHGTNSHDRQIGAEGVLRGLLARRAAGLATTHDLALAQIADALAPRARNVHFEDHFEDGQIAFDYTMRDGVVMKSNALDLMRSIGLDV